MMDTSDPYDGIERDGGTDDVDTAGHVSPDAPDPNPSEVTDPLASSWVAPAAEAVPPGGLL